MSDILMFMGLGGGSPYPTSLTGWWSADSGVYSDAGVTLAVDTNGVYQWNDRVTGGTNYFTQANASLRPTYRTGIVNSKPVLRFGGVTDDDYMVDGNFGALTTTTAKTVFTVAKWTNAGSVWSEANNYCLAYFTGAYVDSYNYSGGYQNVSKACSAATWVIHTYLHNGTTLYSGVSDTRTASLAGVASGTSSGTSSFILGYNFAPGSNPFDGDLAEIITYNTALAEADRQTTERYLAQKYGITIPY
jgi:hypothetical protein